MENPMDFGHFVLRYLHTFAGLIWIGHLYYLNFVQGAFMNEVDAPIKTVAQSKLFPRVMWWFRYGALWTFILGIILILMTAHQMKGFSANSYWINILTGAWLGSLMAYNVWMVIWPRQRKIIENAQNVAQGKPAAAGIADLASRALVASRTNVLFSIPMLWFMLAARHWSYGVNPDRVVIYAIIIAIVTGAIEFNALKGKTGPMTTVKGVLTSGFAFKLILIAIILVVLPL